MFPINSWKGSAPRFSHSRHHKYSCHATLCSCSMFIFPLSHRCSLRLHAMHRRSCAVWDFPLEGPISMNGINFFLFYSYRRKHKKGQEEEQTKKRTRRTQKFQRAIVGASLTDIMAKRNMKPEVRKAQREQAIRYV